MGRKRKFGEESDFVSVHVPKSKRKKYRNAIKNFVERKFANETVTNDNVSNIKVTKKELEGFRKFEEFIEDLKKTDEKEEK